MGGFILVTIVDDNSKILLPVSRIHSAFIDDDGSTFIALSVDGKNRLWGFSVVESFDDIVDELNFSGLVVKP